MSPPSTGKGVHMSYIWYLPFLLHPILHCKKQLDKQPPSALQQRRDKGEIQRSIMQVVRVESTRKTNSKLHISTNMFLFIPWTLYMENILIKLGAIWCS
jgi:hypothetical protein